MKALFFGTSEFAVPSLRVVAANADVVGVVTQPDRPSGRGHKLQPTPVKAAALELGLPVFEPAKLRDFAKMWENTPIDLFVLASYGKILPQALLDIPRLAALNVHPSLLPKYRGATPIQTVLRNGETETGVSIMMMDAGMDTGDIVLQRGASIEPTDNYATLHDRLASIGASMLGEAIELSRRGPLARTPQHGDATVTKPIEKDDLVLDLALPAKTIVDRVRAYSPQPGARATIDGENVKILSAHVDDRGELALDEVIVPNRGKMNAQQFAQHRSRHPEGSRGSAT